jgi:hypothetical protein
MSEPQEGRFFFSAAAEGHLSRRHVAGHACMAKRCEKRGTCEAIGCWTESILQVGRTGLCIAGWSEERHASRFIIRAVQAGSPLSPAQHPGAWAAVLHWGSAYRFIPCSISYLIPSRASSDSRDLVEKKSLCRTCSKLLNKLQHPIKGCCPAACTESQRGSHSVRAGCTQHSMRPGPAQWWRTPKRCLAP